MEVSEPTLDLVAEVRYIQLKCKQNLITILLPYKLREKLNFLETLHKPILIIFITG